MARKIYIYDEKKRKLVLKKDVERPRVHYICPDLPDYQSPVTFKMVSGRRQRREDLKRAGCREVDPSERYYNPVKEEFPECLR